MTSAWKLNLDPLTDAQLATLRLFGLAYGGRDEASGDLLAQGPSGQRYRISPDGSLVQTSKAVSLPVPRLEDAPCL